MIARADVSDNIEVAYAKPIPPKQAQKRALPAQRNKASKVVKASNGPRNEEVLVSLDEMTFSFSSHF
jgi:hypothetical protein